MVFAGRHGMRKFVQICQRIDPTIAISTVAKSRRKISKPVWVKRL
jgi:hypothetical protein